MPGRPAPVPWIRRGRRFQTSGGRVLTFRGVFQQELIAVDHSWPALRREGAEHLGWLWARADFSRTKDQTLGLSSHAGVVEALMSVPIDRRRRYVNHESGRLFCPGPLEVRPGYEGQGLGHLMVCIAAEQALSEACNGVFFGALPQAVDVHLRYGACVTDFRPGRLREAELVPMITPKAVCERQAEEARDALIEAGA